MTVLVDVAELRASLRINGSPERKSNLEESVAAAHLRRRFDGRANTNYAARIVETGLSKGQR